MKRAEVGSTIFVSREDSLLLDLITKRYPGKRPSDYLELEPWDAYQLDVALALKGHNKDTELIESIVKSLAEVMNNGVETICRALGAKVTRRNKTEQQPVALSDKPLPLNAVLQQLGGKGVSVEYIKKL